MNTPVSNPNPRRHHLALLALCLALTGSALVTGCKAVEAPDVGDASPLVERGVPESAAEPESTVAPESGAGSGADPAEPTAVAAPDDLPVIDPANVVAGIDNPFLPYQAGNTWIYEGQTDEGLERTEIVVLEETRRVMGIDCVVVRDTVSLDGVVIEDTYDWYAQDVQGSVWYLGEDVKNFRAGVFVDSHGAWEAGVDGALPGIAMWAEPRTSEPYRQEYYAGHAEDMAKVLGLDGLAEVPAGRFAGLLVIEEWNPLDPGTVEQKLYARGIGLVQERVVEGGDEVVSLIETSLR